jgi:hypothetical protein
MIVNYERIAGGGREYGREYRRGVSGKVERFHM